MFGGLFVVFNRKAVLEENFFGKTTHSCNFTVGIDVSQNYHLSFCQPMQIGFYSTKWYNSDTRRCIPADGKFFENTVFSQTQGIQLDITLEIIGKKS